MSMREVIQNNQAAVAVIAAIIIVGSVMLALRAGSGASGSRQAYFYDLGTGKLFSANRSAQPPIAAPSGAGNGVKAAVYGCGTCGESDLRVAFITKYSDDAIAALAKRQTNAPDLNPATLAAAIDQGTFIAAPPAAGEQPHWVLTTSRDGLAIQGGASFVCGQKPAKPCFPK